jgi:uncharacterized membrane protein
MILCGGRIRYSFGLGEGEVVLIWSGGGRYGTHLVWGPCNLFVTLITLMILMSISTKHVHRKASMDNQRNQQMFACDPHDHHDPSDPYDALCPL